MCTIQRAQTPQYFRMFLDDMPSQVASLRCPMRTKLARKRSLARVNPDMPLEIFSLLEHMPTIPAREVGDIFRRE